jgi:hypothetical protein
MGVLAPWFLLGLTAVGLPLYLHLLRRNSSTPQPFSSLLFFEPRTLRSVRHRRLRYLLLLALRLALLILVVLAFARPFINRPVALAGTDRLQLLLIDRSFSMRAGSRLEDAKDAALAVLARRGLTGRAQVMAFSSRLQVLTQVSTDAATLRSAVSGIEADDSRGDYGEVLNAVRAASGSVQTPIEVHLFTDLQQSNLPSNLEELALPEGVTLVLHRIVKVNEPNWTVETVSAPRQLWGSAKQIKPAQVQAIVAGFGTSAADRTASLIVNGRSVATQPVHVPASGRVSVSFALPTVPYGFSRCEVRIDAGDVLPQDDGYRFALERSDPQQALFVHGPADSRSPLYFGDALAAADGAAFDLQSVSIAQAAVLSLKPYAFVVLSNPAALPPTLESELQRYVRAGGSVLMALGTAAALRVPVFGQSVQETRNYSAGFADGRERFIGVGDIDASQSWAGDAALWSGVKFFYAQRIDEANAQVVVRLTDHTPLLLERRIGEGRVLVLASGLEGLTNDLPLHPAFVALVAQLAGHLSSLPQDSGVRVVDSMLQLHSAEEHGAAAEAGVEVIDPAGRRPLSLTEAASTPSVRLSQAGFYQLRLASGRQELIAVNVDPRESDLALIPEDTLALWQRRPAAQAAVAAASLPSARQPYPLWWFILLLALLAALAEVWVAAGHLDTRREQT